LRCSPRASPAADGRSADLPIHLVDDPKIRPGRPFIAWGAIVFLDGVPRQVLSSSVPVMPPSELPPQPMAPEDPRTDPAEFGALPWLSYEIAASAATRCACCAPGP
jgi:hypothetical protein